MTECAAPEWLQLELMFRFPWLLEQWQTGIRKIWYQEPPDENAAPIDLSYLVDVSGLRHLDFREGPEIGDRDLAFVAGLKQLGYLDVKGPGITNEGVRALSEKHQMEGLRLIDTMIDDDGLQFLASMPRLRTLSLGGSANVTGEGLRHLPRECRLEDLRVTETRFDHGLEYVDVSALDRFFADSTPLTDADLVHLRDARALTQLRLKRTRITDEGLMHLAGLADLQMVLVSGTEVTQAGAERLAAQIPYVSIAYGPDDTDPRWAYGALADKPE